MKKSNEFANPNNPEFSIKGQDFLLRNFDKLCGQLLLYLGK